MMIHPLVEDRVLPVSEMTQKQNARQAKTGMNPRHCKIRQETWCKGRVKYTHSTWDELKKHVVAGTRSSDFMGLLRSLSLSLQCTTMTDVRLDTCFVTIDTKSLRKVLVSCCQSRLNKQMITACMDVSALHLSLSFTAGCMPPSC